MTSFKVNVSPMTWRRGFAVAIRTTALAILCAAMALALLAGCKRPLAEQQPPLAEKKLVVFAASSLRGGFTALAESFNRIQPGVELVFNFAGTQELRTQIEQGADADVFASADQRHLLALERSHSVLRPLVFARNELVVVVAKESTERIKSLSELPLANRIVVGAPEVPVGRYTHSLLERATSNFGADFRARVEARIVSRELNVRQVLSKVCIGEADAGIVYRSDVQEAKGRVGIVAIPPGINVVAEYPIAVVTNAKHPTLAHAWVAFVLGADGQRTLARFGFSAPLGSIAQL